MAPANAPNARSDSEWRRFQAFASSPAVFKVAGEIKVAPARTQCHARAIASPVSSWLATPLQPPAPLPERHRQGGHRRRTTRNVHIPDWLSSDGMARGQDRGVLLRSVRRNATPWSAAKAYSFRRGHHPTTVLLRSAAAGPVSPQPEVKARCAGCATAGSAPGQALRNIKPTPRMESSLNAGGTEGIEPNLRLETVARPSSCIPAGKI